MLGAPGDSVCGSGAILAFESLEASKVLAWPLRPLQPFRVLSSSTAVTWGFGALLAVPEWSRASDFPHRLVLALRKYR